MRVKALRNDGHTGHRSHDDRPLFLDGDDLANTLKGDDGDDTLLGNGGADRISGDRGADEIDGGAGLDVIFGGRGDDVITDYDDLANIRGGKGNDALYSTIGVAYGGAGADSVYGQTGYGGSGDDLLVGEAAASLMFGGTGDDVIQVYALGDDTLYGGSGADTFLFMSSNRGVDEIRDFDAAQDHLDLTELGVAAGDIAGLAAQVGDDTVITVDKGELGVLTVVLVDTQLSAL